MSQAPPPLLRMCSRHGLVAGPEGRCVLCNRKAGEMEASGGGPSVLGVALACTALLGAVLVWKGVSGTRAVAAAETRVVVTALAPPPPPPPPPPDDDDDTRAQRATEEAVAMAHRKDAQQRSRSVEVEMHRVPIKMYVDDRCELCVTARDWMKEKGLQWSEVDVSDNPDALPSIRKLAPKPELPVFDVGGELLEGFGPVDLMGALRRAADKRTP